MTKNEFLAVLEKGLRALSESDKEKSLEYYREMIDDRIESGQTEAEAVADMGNLNDIIAQILAESPKKEHPEKEKRTLSVPIIIMLILGAPIWASLALVAAIVVFAVYVAIWAVVVSFYAVAASFGAVAIAGIFIAALSASAGNFIQMMFYVGVILFFAGATVLLFLACNKISAIVAKLSVLIAKGIAVIFTRKAETK
jgi:uncharacterized membrane protein